MSADNKGATPDIFEITAKIAMFCDELDKAKKEGRKRVEGGAS